MTIASIKSILDARQFDAFIGQEEETWFEAKGRNSYEFATSAGRFELAKDVSALANADGGIVVVGLNYGCGGCPSFS